MKLLKSALIFGLLATLAASQTQATVIVTYAEDPGLMEKSFIKGDVSIFNFNSLQTNTKLTDVQWAGVGSFDKLYVLNADQYGGANNSRYSVQGVSSGVNQTTLTLTNESSYFGLWWSAGDASNVMDFYAKDGSLLAEFTTANLINALPDTYKGNPNTGSFNGMDAHENFAFINFFATPGSAWSTIVFRNSSNSGFEADNYSSRVAVYDPVNDGPMPGVVFEAINGKEEVAIHVPEPTATLAMVLIGGLSMSGALVKRFRKMA